MEDKDLKSLINRLVDALNDSAKGRKSSSDKKEDVETLTKLNLATQKELEEVLKSQERTTGKILKDIELVEKNSANTIDSEQIINELKEERIRKIKEEFRLNQIALLQLRVQLEDAEKASIKDDKAIDDLRTKIKLLEDETKAQGKILEYSKKEQIAKERILAIGKEIWQMTLNYGQELEKHIIAISKLNGGYDKYKDTIGEANSLLYASTVGTGVMFEEANKAIVGLSENFIGLSTQSAESIRNMSLGVAQLGKLGVDAGAASRGFDSLVNSMGKTPQQAYKIQESFVQMASKNRLALDSVTKAFSENSSRFVGYGEQMTKVLDGLAEQSLKTGIAMGKLIGIAQGFDTFEDASRKVGNLNALLGGDYFNSIELLTASDEERIKLLKEGVAASGTQFESMNRFQKMAIANAAGISDLNEASKLFGQTSLQNTRQQAQSAEVQKTLAEQAQSASLSMDKLKSSFNGFLLILEPVVTTLMLVVNVVSDVVQGMNSILSFGGEFPKVGAVLTSVFVGMIAVLLRFGGLVFSVAKTLIASLIPAISSMTASVTPAATATSGAINTIGRAAAGSALGLLALGGAIFLIGAGIGIAALGFAKLVSSFKDLENSGSALAAILIIMVGFTAMVIALASISAPAAASLLLLGSALLYVGAGVLLIGSGIAIAAAGIGYMASNMSKMFDSMKSMDMAQFESLFLLFSDENIKQVEKFAEAMDKLNVPFNTLNANLKSIVANLANAVPDMSLDVTSTPMVAAAASMEAINSSTTNSSINNIKNTSSQSLIPAQQTAFVPLVVQIDKKTIMEVLREDIKNIAKGQALNAIDAIGLTQSAFYSTDRTSTT